MMPVHISIRPDGTCLPDLDPGKPPKCPRDGPPTGAGRLLAPIYPTTHRGGTRYTPSRRKNTHNTLRGRRRPDEEPTPPNGRGHAHRRPLQRRRRPDVDPPPPMQMPMTMVVPRRRRREEVQHVDHRRAPHVIARRPRQIIERVAHRRVETSTRVRVTTHTDAARRVRAFHHII